MSWENVLSKVINLFAFNKIPPMPASNYFKTNKKRLCSSFMSISYAVHIDHHHYYFRQIFKASVYIYLQLHLSAVSDAFLSLEWQRKCCFSSLLSLHFKSSNDLFASSVKLINLSWPIFVGHRNSETFWFTQ